MWIIFASLSAVTAALVAIFGKIGLKDIDPTLATTLRAFLMAAMLGAVSLFSGKFKGFTFEALGSKAWIMIVLAGLAGAASWLFYFLALQQGDASRVSAIDRLSIVLVVVCAALFLGESFTWKTGLGAGLIFVGALMIAMK